VVEIGGPDDLTFNELAARVQEADGREGPPRHVPPAALRVLAQTVGRVRPALGRQVRAAAAMDALPMTFDSGAVRSRYPGLPCTAVTDLLA
jgi:uncharacterized protein YbjT (DUF2867 family)